MAGEVLPEKLDTVLSMWRIKGTKPGLEEHAVVGLVLIHLDEMSETSPRSGCPDSARARGKAWKNMQWHVRTRSCNGKGS